MSKYPIILRRRLPDDQEATLLIDRIPTLSALLEQANQADIESISSLVGESRRRERLAWRILLRDFLDREIDIRYDSASRPSIIDEYYTHISVSHCDDLVAVTVSRRACGVDVERLDRNFGGVLERYSTSEELSMCRTPLERAVVWSAKEALYKLAANPSLHMLSDIHITAIDLEHHKVRGVVCCDGRDILQCDMSLYQSDENHIIVYRM